MTMFWILGLFGVLILVEMKCLDVAKARGYKEGFAAGYEKNQREMYEAGKLASDNWWISCDDGAEAARKKIWNEEIGA